MQVFVNWYIFLHAYDTVSTWSFVSRLLRSPVHPNQILAPCDSDTAVFTPYEFSVFRNKASTSSELRINHSSLFWEVFFSNTMKHVYFWVKIVSGHTVTCIWRIPCHHHPICQRRTFGILWNKIHHLFNIRSARKYGSSGKHRQIINKSEKIPHSFMTFERLLRTLTLF